LIEVVWGDMLPTECNAGGVKIVVTVWQAKELTTKLHASSFFCTSCEWAPVLRSVPRTHQRSIPDSVLVWNRWKGSATIGVSPNPQIAPPTTQIGLFSSFCTSEEISKDYGNLE
jgi:hypothetical protein